MNLVHGKILDAKDCDVVLDHLEQDILSTLGKSRLDPQTVIAACDKVLKNLDETDYIQTMKELGINESLSRSYISEARQLFGKESLQHRLQVELGDTYGKPVTFHPIFKEFAVTQQTLPLGVLLHIAAGNADGLPAFSILEGLLTGNINILKLPAAEGGITVRLLMEFIKAEPVLAEYIYVFDYSSKDIEHIEKLISVADAVVIWGGKEAVSALRRMIPSNTKIIEWGHKISFAYVTEEAVTTGGLEGLAKNIVETGQLLCSSLQGIFLDTDDMDKVYEFCKLFIPVLDHAIYQRAQDLGMGIKSQVALKLYAEELEGIYNGSRVFRGSNCSLIAYPDKILDTSIQFGNAWVKPLPRNEILSTLRPYKNYLQTAGLICSQSDLPLLSDILFKTGVVRVCPGENMSLTYCGAPHDGEYPLRRYTKTVDIEQGIC